MFSYKTNSIGALSSVFLSLQTHSSVVSEIWEKMQRSYKQSVKEISELLKRKVTFCKSLRVWEDGCFMNCKAQCFGLEVYTAELRRSNERNCYMNKHWRRQCPLQNQVYLFGDLLRPFVAVSLSGEMAKSNFFFSKLNGYKELWSVPIHNDQRNNATLWRESTTKISEKC